MGMGMGMGMGVGIGVGTGTGTGTGMDMGMGTGTGMGMYMSIGTCMGVRFGGVYVGMKRGVTTGETSREGTPRASGCRSKQYCMRASVSRRLSSSVSWYPSAPCWSMATLPTNAR